MFLKQSYGIEGWNIRSLSFLCWTTSLHAISSRLTCLGKPDRRPDLTCLSFSSFLLFPFSSFNASPLFSSYLHYSPSMHSPMLVDSSLHQFHCSIASSSFCLSSPIPSLPPFIHPSSLSLHPLPCLFQPTKCLHLFSLHLVSCFSCFDCPLSFTYLCHLQQILKHLALCTFLFFLSFLFSIYSCMLYIKMKQSIILSRILVYIADSKLGSRSGYFPTSFLLFIFPFRPSIEQVQLTICLSTFCLIDFTVLLLTHLMFSVASLCFLLPVDKTRVAVCLSASQSSFTFFLNIFIIAVTYDI